METALYEGITFTPCFDASLSAVPYLFGDTCSFRFSGLSGSRVLESGTGVTCSDWGYLETGCVTVAAASNAAADDALTTLVAPTNAPAAHAHMVYLIDY